MLRLSFALSAFLAVTAVDTDGQSWTLLAPAERELDLLLFVATDCPISNRYAPEIARICADYRPKGVRCFLVYPDTGLDPGRFRRTGASTA